MDIDEAIEFIITHPSESPLAIAARVILQEYQNARQYIESSERMLSDMMERLDAADD